MKFLRIAMVILFVAGIATFSSCGDKNGSESSKDQVSSVENIKPDNAEKKADEVLKEIEKL